MTTSSAARRAAVVLDIDGVIHRGGIAIPGSAAAVQRLFDAGIPFCFLTNGGGTTESAKAVSLSTLLENVPIQACQVVLAHTPFRHLVAQYAESRVLVIGGSASISAMRGYGFHRAVAVLELQSDFPELVPFKEFEGQWAERAEQSRRLHSTWPVQQLRAAIQEAITFAAVFFLDSVGVDGLNDVQVAVDALTRVHPSPSAAPEAQLQAVPFFMQADDDFWAASQAVGPRLGESLFRKLLEIAFHSSTGNALRVVQFGKPRKVAFDEAALALQAAVDNVAAFSSRRGGDAQPLYYMVGDNCHVDILGANALGTSWRSILVDTGVGLPVHPSKFRHAPVHIDQVQRHSGIQPHVASSTDDFAERIRLHALATPGSEATNDTAAGFRPWKSFDNLETFVSALLTGQLDNEQ